MKLSTSKPEKKTYKLKPTISSNVQLSEGNQSIIMETKLLNSPQKRGIRRNEIAEATRSFENELKEIKYELRMSNYYHRVEDPKKLKLKPQPYYAINMVRSHSTQLYKPRLSAHTTSIQQCDFSAPVRLPALKLRQPEVLEIRHQLKDQIIEKEIIRGLSQSLYLRDQ